MCVAMCKYLLLKQTTFTTLYSYNDTLIVHKFDIIIKDAA